MVKSSETERKERMDTSSLMEQILSSDNLNRAYLQVVRNKGAEGVDGMKYTELKEYLAKNGEIIKEQLRMRKYKPQPVRRVEIPKPDGGVRNLGVPTVTDRFIQQAIAQVLTPIYEEQFHEHSYGFRPNRCAQQAILTALDMMNDGNDWIVDIDLEKFFDTVNHDKLMTIIGRTIKDGDVISIIRKYLDCQHFFRQIFLGYFSDIVQAFDTLRKNVCGDDYTSLHNPIVLSSVLPAYGMFHSIQILFL